MKFRLGFVSNSSSSSFIVAFPKSIPEEEIYKALFEVKNPPLENLARDVGFPNDKWLVEMLDEFLKGLTIYKQTDEKTIYEVSIPFRLFSSVKEFTSDMSYRYGDDSRFNKYDPRFKGLKFGELRVSNEDEDPLSMILYFTGFWHIKLHPEIKIIDSD